MKIDELTLVKISSVLLVLLAVFFSTIIIGFTIPIKTVEIKQPMEILNENKTVAPGEAIKFSLDYTKPRHYTDDAQLAFYCDNGKAFFYEPKPETLPIGTHKLVSDYNIIPIDQTDGTCHLVIDLEIDYGFLGRKEAKLIRSEDFHIKREQVL